MAERGSEMRVCTWRRLWIAIVALAVGACAGYGGAGLQPGVSSAADVAQRMGAPALRWQAADGSVQLAYPRGPMGFHTFMVFLAPDGKLARIENALDPDAFGRLQAGMSQDDVLRLFGPPVPAWTVYFKARDELVWEWRFCDDWGQPARFDVLFDATSGLVRTAYQRREDHRQRREFCSR